MIRPTRLALLASAAVAATAAGCGSGKIEVSKDQRTLREGAVLFNQRCSGCHTLKVADAYGSKPEGQVQPGERTNGPNFSIRKESRDDVLFAIRNGGFSGAIMPANIVVGRDAELVADFVARYSGRSSSKANPPPAQRAP